MSISCDCSMDVDGCDIAEFYKKSILRARKNHICNECSEVIVKGSMYEKITGKWDGEIITHKTCIPCTRVRSNYCPNGSIMGELREHLEECIGFDYTEVPEDD